ncbi:hypothetical protein G6F64_014626 [Rhizopus arrhizus]|nr:hypothetical protein G6F64_014626 [Rhizopus arrhizus]KAG1487983.1 hypothetical protein G6F52_014056 [Rhizopus delemar]
MTRGLQRGGTQYVGLAQSRPSQPLQFIVVAETAQPGIGADQHGDARTMRGTGLGSAPPWPADRRATPSGRVDPDRPGADR